MIDQSLAHPAHETTTEPQPGYVLRGLGLFELHQDAILEGYLGGGRWLVPSGTVADRLYEVRAGTRPERNRCECIGFGHHGRCSHITAATEARGKSAVCDGCGGRFRHRDLYEVGEDNLAFFEGDRLCESCGIDHGVL